MSYLCVVLINLRPTTPIIHYKSYGKQTSETTRGQSAESQINLTKNYKGGGLSPCAAKRATIVGSYMCERWKRQLHNHKHRRGFNKPTLAFVTLTYPNVTLPSHKDCKRLHLNTFLIQLKRLYNNVDYLWRCELQQNGNIHFHILLTRFISKRWLNQQWYRILRRFGIYDSDLTKEQISKLPATNVAACRSALGVRNYLLKYITKNSEDSAPAGRQWGSNLDSNDCKGVVVEVSVGGFHRMCTLRASGKVPCMSLEYCTLVLSPSCDFVFTYFPELIPSWLSFLQEP